MTRIIDRTRLPDAPSLPRPPVSAYAPGGFHNSNDPIRVADMISKAVDQIGEDAADQIEKTAAAIEAAAKEKADKLRVLANAMREHTRMAAADIAEFSAKTTSVFQTIHGLQAKITGEEEKAEPEDREELPKFLQNGNGETHE